MKLRSKDPKSATATAKIERNGRGAKARKALQRQPEMKPVQKRGRGRPPLKSGPRAGKVVRKSQPASSKMKGVKVKTAAGNITLPDMVVYIRPIDEGEVDILVSRRIASVRIQRDPAIEAMIADWGNPEAEADVEMNVDEKEDITLEVPAAMEMNDTEEDEDEANTSPSSKLEVNNNEIKGEVNEKANPVVEAEIEMNDNERGQDETSTLPVAFEVDDEQEQEEENSSQGAAVEKKAEPDLGLTGIYGEIEELDFEFDLETGTDQMAEQDDGGDVEDERVDLLDEINQWLGSNLQSE